VIALWGAPGDGPLDAVHAELVRTGVPFVLIDQRDAARSSVSSCVAGGQFHLIIDAARATDRIDFANVGAAYLRPTETERAMPPELVADAAARVCAERVDRELVTWADLSTVLVVNPPAAMAANNAKPYQLGLITGYGFDVPATLVTTNPLAVRAFVERHGRLIYKSVSGVRSIVNVIDGTGLARLDEVANVPTQFQAFVPGFDVRVHVVGSDCFATEIRSAAYDYRYASLSDASVALAPFELPAAIAQRCRVMAAGMGLSVAGIDLRCTPGGTWVCFEVNPSPAFVYYEEATGQPIAAAIAALLARADRAHARARGAGRGGGRRGGGSSGGVDEDRRPGRTTARGAGLAARMPAHAARGGPLGGQMG